MTDPGFESGTAGFRMERSSDSAVRSTTSPIAGVASLRVSLAATDGSQLTLTQDYAGSGRGLRASGTFRNDGTAAMDLEVCASAYLSDWTRYHSQCTKLSSLAAGASRTVTATLPFSAGARTARVYYEVRALQRSAKFSMDNVYLGVVR